jgi:hypothetical protein
VYCTEKLCQCERYLILRRLLGLTKPEPSLDFDITLYKLVETNESEYEYEWSRLKNLCNLFNLYPATYQPSI